MRQFQTLQKEVLGDRAVAILKQLDDMCGNDVHSQMPLSTDPDSSEDEEVTAQDRADLADVVKKLKADYTPRRDHS